MKTKYQTKGPKAGGTIQKQRWRKAKKNKSSLSARKRYDLARLMDALSLNKLGV